MAVIQLNPIGMQSTDEGYISSITLRTAGSAQVLTPDGTGKVICSAQAATRLIGGQYNISGGVGGQAIKLVSG